MRDWKEYYLTEFLELNPKVETLNTQEYSFVEMPDLEPGRKYVFPSRKRKPNGLTKFQNGDTLFAKITPCLENGKICQVQGLEDNIGVGSTEFFVFRGKENVSDSDFVHYLLKWYPLKKYAEKNMSGSAGHQRVPVDCLHSLKLLLPSYEENKRIGALLSVLDIKIQNLQKQNQTLEKIAQTLFKHWFVDFNFPDENGKPYKDYGGEMVGSELGEIPKNWDAKIVEDIVLNLDNKRIPLSSRQRDDKAGKYPYYGASGIVDFIDEYIFEGDHILFSEDGENLRSRKQPIVFLVGNKFWVNNHAHILRGKKKIYFYFIYLFLSSIDVSHIITGAVQPKINKTNLHSIELACPDDTVVIIFDRIVTPLFNKIKNNKKQIEAMTKTRDTLLPKLMSGKIRVSE